MFSGSPCKIPENFLKVYRNLFHKFISKLLQFGRKFIRLKYSLWGFMKSCTCQSNPPYPSSVKSLKTLKPFHKLKKGIKINIAMLWTTSLWNFERMLVKEGLIFFIDSQYFEFQISISMTKWMKITNTTFFYCVLLRWTRKVHFYSHLSINKFLWYILLLNGDLNYSASSRLWYNVETSPWSNTRWDSNSGCEIQIARLQSVNQGKSQKQ